MTHIFKKRRKPILEAIGQSLLLLSFIVAILYGGDWYPPDLIPLMPAIIKGCAVGLLALFVIISLQSFNHFILFLALVASVIGDVLLALPHEQAFIRGLAAFLVAHLLFIALYLKNILPLEDISALRLRIAALLWAVAVSSAYFLYPHLGDMMPAVFTYTAVLTVMATAAILSKFPVKLVAFGAILFVVSDALLGAQQFLSVPEFTGYFVWATYYLAQLLMTLGVILTDDRPTHFGGYRFD